MKNWGFKPFMTILCLIVFGIFRDIYYVRYLRFYNMVYNIGGIFIRVIWVIFWIKFNGIFIDILGYFFVILLWFCDIFLDINGGRNSRYFFRLVCKWNSLRKNGKNGLPMRFLLPPRIKIIFPLISLENGLKTYIFKVLKSEILYSIIGVYLKVSGIT